MLLDSDAPPDLTVTEPAITVENLWFRFRTTTERSADERGGKATRYLRSSKRRRWVDALQDVSFDVPRGAVFAVVGRNGAGKTTLCRALAGILPPSKGRITVHGRVTPMLSLGLGLNKELTGRENVLLGGLAAGLDPETVNAHAEEIMEFAELGDALDSPMRTYSSGMGGRLAFSIITHLNPEIIIIDEALSAGDPKFKEKCKEKLEELCAEDTTVVLVTHGLGLVKAMADQVLWLDRGAVRMVGPTGDVLDAYQAWQGTSDSSAAAMDDI